MIEMISIVTIDVQREIIACLPEVVEDSEHGTVATALRDLLSHNTQLTVPILDALANLNLTSDLLTEVSDLPLFLASYSQFSYYCLLFSINQLYT